MSEEAHLAESHQGLAVIGIAFVRPLLSAQLKAGRGLCSTYRSGSLRSLSSWPAWSGANLQPHQSETLNHIS